MQSNEFYEGIEDGFLNLNDFVTKRKPRPAPVIPDKTDKLTALETIALFVSKGYSQKTAQAAVSWLADSGGYHHGYTLQQVEWVIKKGGFSPG